MIFLPGGYKRIQQFYWLRKFPPLTVIGWYKAHTSSRNFSNRHHIIQLIFAISLRKLYLLKTVVLIFYVRQNKMSNKRRRKTYVLLNSGLLSENTSLPMTIVWVVIPCITYQTWLLWSHTTHNHISNVFSVFHCFYHLPHVCKGHQTSCKKFLKEKIYIYLDNFIHFKADLNSIS